MSTTAPTVSAAPPPGAAAFTPRRGILLVLYGKQAFRKVVLEPGQTVTVGRTDRARVVIDDTQMSGLHFSIWWSGARAIVRDLETPNGTAINGLVAPMGTVEQGGFFVAGLTTFQVFAEAATAPSEAPPTPERVASVELLTRELGPVDGAAYAVLDAARTPRILRLLGESIDDHQNLYEGAEGRALDDVAPYLVRFAGGSGLRERLLLGGWGDAWGIYLRSTQAPKDVRRQLRRLLMVQDETTLARMYFRFYDPRVLREFLPLATPRQREEMLGGIEAFYFEQPGGALDVLRSARPPAQGEG